jgi:hypothetical protein
LRLNTIRGDDRLGCHVYFPSPSEKVSTLNPHTTYPTLIMYQASNSRLDPHLGPGLRGSVSQDTVENASFQDITTPPLSQ